MAFCSIGCLLVLVAHYGLAETVIDDAEPGGNITLKCGVDPSKINQYAHARVSWYRQEPDGRIQIVTSLSTAYLKDGRYSGGIDNKNGQYNLTIAGLHRNDSAVYFCIARAAALQFVPGSSTKLVVSDGLAETVIDDAEPGGNITLKCGVDPSKINQYAHARVSWYRQEPDGRIQIVTSLSTAYLKDGRYSGGIDNKNGQYNLTIAGLHRNDSAVYFCIARAAALQFVPGSSTKLVVSDPLTVPSVELYSPGLFEGNTDWTEPVPVLCLVRDTSPGRHRVNWTIGAEAPAQVSAEEGEIEPDGSYSVRSYVTISADQWNSGAIKCEADNVNNVTEKVSASLRRQDCVPVLFYGLPAVLLLILVVVSVACVYIRLHKTKTDHKSSDAPCRPQRPARHRTVQDYSTEYASLNL